MTTPTQLERLGAFVAELDLGRVPADVLDAARLQVLNTVAALHAGARSAVTKPVREAYVAGVFGEGRATALATGARLGAADAAAANAALSMAQDFDDVVLMGHTGHSAVFASLAVAEQEEPDASLDAMLLAVVVANEIGGRIGASCVLGPLNGQMWTFLHHACAAAAAAKLLGLGAEDATHALAVALAQPGFALQPAFLAPTSKLLAAATPTAIGLAAAYHARAGLRGHAGLLEDPRGFWSRFSFLPLPELLEGLGERWVTRTLQVKTYPGCHYFQTACTAIARIQARRGGPFRASEVERVRIGTTKLGMEATRFATEYGEGAREVGPVNVNFDLATTAAVMLDAGRLGADDVEPAALAARTAAVRAWLGKTEVRHDPALTAETVRSLLGIRAVRRALKRIRPREVAALVRRYREEYVSRLITPREALGWLKVGLDAPRARRAARTGDARGEEPAMSFPNDVEIRFRGGTVERERVDVPIGSFGLPGMRDELARKWRVAAAPALGEERARAAWNALAVKPGATTVREIVALLTAVHRSDG